MPFAFSPPSLMAKTSTTDWFEFITGAAFFGTCGDIILTSGFNDQEPWLAILELSPIIASLLPTFEAKRAGLSLLQRLFSQHNAC
jgi:hypothetical protein